MKKILNEDTVRAIRDWTNDKLDGKVDKISGKGLSTNDFTTEEKTKLAGIESGADVNIIETVKVDGTSLVPDGSKAVNIVISGKLDKVSSGSKIYGTDVSGNQTTYTFDLSDAAVTAGSLVKRNARGSVTVPAPVVNTDATTKQYVDTFGRSLEVSLDNINYQLTTVLKDNNGNTLSSQVVDLPIEGDITNIIFSNEDNSLHVTYRNGSTSIVPLYNLTINSAYVDDTDSVDHKFVTASEKAQIETNKQSIATLSGDVATQVARLDAGLAGKQATLATMTPYSAKGTATKIPQITTNNLGQVVTIAEIPARTIANGTLTLIKGQNYDYTLTLTLTDDNGDAIGNPSVVGISIPTESVIVSGAYDSVNRAILLTLDTGSVISIPVADLVQGLVPAETQIAGIKIIDISAQGQVLRNGISASDLSAALASEMIDDLFTITAVTVEEDEQAA